jgi:hypothetical protein
MEATTIGNNGHCRKLSGIQPAGDDTSALIVSAWDELRSSDFVIETRPADHTAAEPLLFQYRKHGSMVEILVWFVTKSNKS